MTKEKTWYLTIFATLLGTILEIILSVSEGGDPMRSRPFFDSNLDQQEVGNNDRFPTRPLTFRI